MFATACLHYLLFSPFGCIIQRRRHSNMFILFSLFLIPLLSLTNPLWRVIVFFSFLFFFFIDFFPCCCFSSFPFGTKCGYLGALNLKRQTYGNKITRHKCIIYIIYIFFTLQTQLAVYFIMKVNKNRDGKVM